MSRCFPYPPPGYVRGVTSLAESIKLQKVTDQEKERKKEKKREHKGKKDERKRSRESCEQTTDDKQIQKRRHIDKETNTDQKVQSLQTEKVQFLSDHKVKVQVLPEEQLERSGLTEELGQPHQPYQCGSPDSSASEDSSKRRRIGGRHIPQAAQATGLRIRFALSKAKTPEEVPVASSNILRFPVPAPAAASQVVPPEAIRSSLVPPRPAPARKEPEVVVPRPSTYNLQEVAPESLERPSFSGRTEAASTSRQLITSDGSVLLEGYRGSKKSRKREAKFNDLFLNWTPPPLLEPLWQQVEDDNWLFNTSSRQAGQAQRDTGTCFDRSTGNGQPSHADSLCSWPPRACHLEDADIYALPYVVPF